MSQLSKFAHALIRRVLGLAGASVLTLAFFLVLPIMQAIGAGPADDMDLTDFDTANIPPPPPPPVEEEPEPEDPDQEPPPELTMDSQPLDLSQLELALNPGAGDGFGPSVIDIQLPGLGGGGGGMGELANLADLDQKPRILHQPSPVLSEKVRKRAPGTVYVLFIVDEDGRVTRPKVQKSTDPIFERPALNAVKQWKFEPGKRKGQPVSFRMRVPISFPKS